MGGLPVRRWICPFVGLSLRSARGRGIMQSVFLLLSGVFLMSIFAVAGSRFLPFSMWSSVGLVCGSAVDSGSSLVVGCAKGADAAVLFGAGQYFPVPSLAVFAAFDSDGWGACSVSNRGPVQAFARRGGSVSWMAGGSPSVPLRARLAARSLVVVGAASEGVLLFPGSAVGSGSALVLRLAAYRSLPVFCFGGVAPPGSVPSSVFGLSCSVVRPPVGLF